MGWLWEPIVIPRLFLWFLLGMGIAYILETIVRMLLTTHLKTLNHKVNKWNECAEEKGFEEQRIGIKRKVSKENVDKQKSITQTEGKANDDKYNTK